MLLCMTGEPALAAPSYYFTKPPGAPADSNASTCQPPPDGAQRFSLRVRGIAAQKDITEGESEKTKTDVVCETSSTQPPYRMVTKRIPFRRSTALPRSASPWCRSRRRVYRKVIVYVDENGKELSALDMHKRTKAGKPSQSVAAETDKQTEKNSKTLSSPSSETRSRRLSVNKSTAASAGDESVAGNVSVQVRN